MSTRQRRQPAPPQEETTTLERLVELLDGRGTGRTREHFKAPEFDGRTDVDLFIQQFLEVADANHWEDGAILLHLRESLKDGARECSRARTAEGILTALRARYGMTVKEARAMLTRLRKEPGTALQEHATQVEKLVNLAHGDLPANYREGMLMDQFSSTLGYPALQRHLLAVAPTTIEEAVRAGNEFLQVHLTANRPHRPVVQMVEDEEDDGQDQEQATQPSRTGLTRAHPGPVRVDPGSTQVDPGPALAGMGPLMEMMKAITALTHQLAGLSHRQSVSAGGRFHQEEGPQGRPTRPCWDCGKTGHFRRDCKEPLPKTTRPTNQGNGRGPQ